jgi:mRNA interferase MazF
MVLRVLPRFRDLLVCGISTQLHQEVVGIDERIGPSDTDYAGSGLRAESVIRLTYLAVLSRHSVLGNTGFVSAERHHRLLRTLAEYLVT